jgi:hypothetical protein
MRVLASLAPLALAACAPQAAKSFDISALQPTVEADQKTLTGWFQMDDGFREFRLYPAESDLGKVGGAVCLSGLALSLAGVPPPDFNGQRMTVTGSVHRVGSAEAGATADPCGAGMVLLAVDIAVAE